MFLSTLNDGLYAAGVGFQNTTVAIVACWSRPWRTDLWSTLQEQSAKSYLQKWFASHRFLACYWLL